MYAAQTGTFAQRDPLPQGGPILGYSDEAVTAMRNRSSDVVRAGVNLYEYVFGNPVVSTDPSGLLTDCNAENILCNQACMKKPKKCFPDIKSYKGKIWKWAKTAACEALCQALYMECVAENGLESAFESLEEAMDWLILHPELVVVGAVVIVAGVTYIVSTGGTGALILVLA